jgi:PAS domain S-box-containing protein
MKKVHSMYSGLINSGNLYPSILESIAEGIVVIGLDKKIIFLNKMARELIGISDENVQALHCRDIINTDLCLNNCPLDSGRDKSLCTSHFININLHRDDEPAVPLCLNVAPFRDDNGQIIGIIENFRPMSEAVKVMESLRESNILLSQEKDKVDSIVESLADGIFTVDIDMKITSFSRGMEKMTGLAEKDVVGKRCEDVLNGDNCEENCPLSQTISRGYGLAGLEERIGKKDGSTVPIIINTAFLKDRKGGTGLIAVVRDASEIEKLRKDVNERYRFSNIIGKSSGMQQIFELIEVLGEADCPILIEGESGTGKELVSRAIHHESDRRGKPFVKVNCSAIVEGLFESELFGHVRGAFSGAIRDKVGKFELADGGTIFLDEIADMPLNLQPKLLRVLQDMEFERVGDNRTRKVDVRVVAATNRNMAEEIEAGRFRKDLYYRLCVVPIMMPPLRERKEDIPLLAEHFLETYRRKMPARKDVVDIEPSAMAALLEYDWPGNVRELENAIEHACLRTKTDRIDTDALPDKITTHHQTVPAAPNDSPAPTTIDLIEKHYIQELMRKHKGNKTLVAKNLGISRTTLWRRLRELQ